MSKNKGSADKSGARKIPKRIAGVKIPKGLRESGNAAVKLAQSPMARELLTAGLAAAAAAVVANTRARKDAQQGGADATKAFADVATKSAGEIKAALVEAASVAAQQFFSQKFKAPADTAKGPDANAHAENAEDPQADPDMPLPAEQGASPSKAKGVNGSGTRPARVRAAKPVATPAA